MKRQISILACLVMLVAVVLSVASCKWVENKAHTLITDHEYEETVTKAPTCTEKGVKTLTCSCGDTKTEEIPATGHVLEDVAAKAATCTEDGYTAYKDCKNCDYVEGKTVEPKDPSKHVIAEGDIACFGCNKIIVTTTEFNGWQDDFTFVANAEGTYTFTLPAGYGWYSAAQFADFGAPEVDFETNSEGATVVVALEAGEEYGFTLASPKTGEQIIAFTFVAGEISGEDSGNNGGDDTVVTNPTLVVGDNDVTIGADQLTDGADYTLVVPADTTYIVSSNDVLCIALDSTGMQVGRGQITLATGTYTIKVIAMSGAGTYEVSVTVYTETETSEPDGSIDNPYVWDTIPASVTINSDCNNKKYYIFTANVSGSIFFTWPEGNEDSWWDIEQLVNGETIQDGGDSGYCANVHSFTIESGKTYRVGLATWNNSGEYVITITTKECNHTWSEATCETNKSVCSGCGAEKTVNVSHTPGDAATCTTNQVCTVCGEVLTYASHSWDWTNGTVTVQPDCITETNGTIEYPCKNCDETYEETKLYEHKWNADPTCTTGSSCTVDGCNGTQEPTGHWASDYSASCGDTTTCGTCGESYVIEHQYGNATCTSPSTCYKCWGTTGEALGHLAPEGSVCGQEVVCCRNMWCGTTFTVVNHVDANADAKCDVESCGKYFAPAVGTAFKLKLVQANLNKVLFFAGSGTDFLDTGDYNAAVDLYLEAVEGGYNIYFLVDETKTYVNIYTNTSSKIRLNLSTDAETVTVWAFDETYGMFTTAYAEDTYYIGTYDNYSTLSVSKTSFVDQDNVDKSQFIARPVVIPADHVCSSWSAATCEVLATCTVCGTTTGELAAHTPGDAATCTTAQVCTVCGDVVEGATGHTTEDGVCGNCGNTISPSTGLSNAVLDLSNSSNRTSFSTESQVWEANGIKVTNSKANSTSNVADYTPPRFYKGSTLTVEAKGMTTVVFVCNNSTYASALVASLSDSSYTATASGSTVTLTFTEAVDSFTITLSAQVRMGNSITVNPAA